MGTLVLPGRRPITAYLALVVAPIVGLLAVFEVGRGLPPAAGIAPAAGALVPAANAVLNLPLFLVQLAVIIAAARALGLALRRLGQPQVVGEMIAGLLLGPSFLGSVAPAAYAWLFPLGTVRFINALSQVGLVLFMFLMGLELDLEELLERSRRAFLTAHASIAVPMFSGAALALFLYERYAPAGTSFPVFALFIGCAMSVTAFPVLARILAANRLTSTPFGALALACAAIADVTAWVILAFVIAIARGNGRDAAMGTLGRSIGLTAAYLATMFLLVRPGLAHAWKATVTRRSHADPASESITQDDIVTALIVVLLSAVATEYLQIHALFGAFVAGVVMPSDRRFRESIASRFEDLLAVLLLPLFFARAGLRTDLRGLTAGADWIACLAVVAVAVVSKIGGGMFGARATGATWRNAGALGILMNARGLMELVLLTIGLQAGIITTQLFTVMVLMAIVTTLMTTPLLALVRPSDPMVA